MGQERQLVTRAAAGALAFGVVALLDQATAPDVTAGALVVATCLGGSLGALAASALLGWTAVLSRAGRTVAIGFWFGVGALVAIALCWDLGIGARIGGPYTALAIGAAIALLGGAVVFGVAGLALTEKRGGWSWVEQQPRALRLSLGTIGASVGAILTTVERGFLVGAYPLERAALQVGVMAAMLFASVCVVAPEWKPKAWSRRAAVAVLWLSGLVPLVVLGRKESALSAGLSQAPYPSLVLRTYRWLLDWDRDGYSALLGGGDCDDGHAEVNPGRAEVAGNGRDDNCLGGDRRITRLRYEPESVPRAAGPSPVSVVLISVDTLSAAHMSAYGYRRPTTPHLERWARERGRLFENAYTPSTSTQYALGGVMRGVYPRRLQWSAIRVVDSFGVSRHQAMPIREWRLSLSEWLSRRGMLTLAFTDDGTSRYMEAKYNIGGRFDEWTDARRLFAETDDAALSRAVIARLAKVESDRRFFLWVHYYGPHAPTTRHTELTWFGSSTEDEYDHEVLAFDHGVALLLDALVARQNAGEPLVVILLADHGEDLNQVERTHGLTLDEDSLRVPLVISAPGLGAGRVRSLVSTLDVFPTALGYTETPFPPDLDGRDLRPLFSDGSVVPRIVLAETWAYLASGARYRDQAMATDGAYRLIRSLNPSWSRFESVARGRSSDLLPDVQRPALEQALDAYLDEVAPPDL